MISIEEKLPHDTFLKWEDYKSELKSNKKNVTLNDFTIFFGEKIRKEENANFVRQKPDNDGKAGKNKTRVKMYQTNVKEKQKGNAHRYNRPHQKQNRAQPPHPAQKTNRPKYCIFCENSSHYSNTCKATKHTKAFKEQQCAKHNACYACLKTTDHKADSCPFKKTCWICNRQHHYKMHTAAEIKEFWKKNPERNKKSH